MRRLVYLLFVACLTFVTVFAADGVDDQGNPNDPTVNERANACYEGGSMEDKCDTDWEWTCGWYVIRYEEGFMSRTQMPAFCEILIDAAPAGCAVDDFYTISAPKTEGYAFIDVPGVLANDTCTAVVGYGNISILQDGYFPDLPEVEFLVVYEDGSFEYQVNEPGIIFTFTYTTENGSTAMVRVGHDLDYVD